MENTIIKIVISRKLTDEECEKIGKWLADKCSGSKIYGETY